MNFGPLTPQEIDGIVEFLEKNSIPFEISFNRQAADEEIAHNAGNSLALGELRTKAYMAQHFYIDVPDEFLINNPKVEAQILKKITNHDFEEIVRTEEDNIIAIDDEKIMQRKSNRTKFIQRIFAILFLISMLYGIFSSLRN